MKTKSEITSTMVTTASIRHDEQEDERHYDQRAEADDDTRKGKIRFPESKLFGRDAERKRLFDLFSTLIARTDPLESNQHAARVAFVEGFSGSGKSSLVYDLIHNLTAKSIPHVFAKGKYSEHMSAEPFSAINQAISSLVLDLRENHPAILSDVRCMLRESENLADRNVTKLFSMMPCLRHLFSPTETSQSSTTNDAFLMNDIKATSHLFVDFMRLLCATLKRPLIMFLDDIQWSDQTSLDLLEPLLSTTSIDNFFFIGSFRSNEVKANKPLSMLIDSLEGSIGDRFCRIEVQHLSLEDVTSFVAETLELDVKTVRQLSEAIFSRTFGNILFCRQAIEELARKNAIFYDVMTFQWEFNLRGMDLHALLSDDVVEMIQSKLTSLSPPIQQVLIVASYIRNVIDESVLLQCLRAHGIDMSRTMLQDALRVAAKEGLLLKVCHSNEYKFSHDKVQEAAYRSVPRSEKRYRLKAAIASVLFSILEEKENVQEWTMFVAAEYFGSIPRSMVKEDSLQLARLFQRVAELCARKGSFEKASWYLNRGVDCLRLKENMWQNHYDICVSLFNQLIMIEFARGDMDGTKVAIDEVVWNGKSLKDTCIALYTKVDWMVATNSRNYSMGANESMKLLGTYGQHFPSNPSKMEMLMEHAQMTIAMRGRRISDMASLPLAEDDSLMKLIFQLCHLLSLAHNHTLNRFVTMRAIRLSLEKGITKYMSKILMTYTIPLRIDGKLQLSYSYATVVSSIYERFPEDRGAEYARAQMILYVGIVPLKIRFSEGIDVLYSTYGLALSCGDVETALVSAMHLPMHYHASSLPLNSMLETRVKLFEEKSKQYHQPSFTAIFQCCRQFQQNLVYPCEKPAALQGSIMDEDKVLADLDGNNKSMTIRDFGMFRMMLAVIFDDEETMEEMMIRLEAYPYFDLPVVRMHLRLLYHGLASLLLGRRKAKRDYCRQGLEMMKEFQKLVRIGSENAQPVYKCFQAVYQNKRRYYEEAIGACSAMNLTHLEALMNEHCGFMYQEAGDHRSAEYYMGRAMWLYHDWGALAKVYSMKKRYPFLQKASRDCKTGRTSLSTFIQQANTSLSESVGATGEDPFQLRSRCTVK